MSGLPRGLLMRGPWSDDLERHKEDKVEWTDEKSGYKCSVVRSMTLNW